MDYSGYLISLSFEDAGGAHASTDAHRDDSVFSVNSLKLVEHRDDHACAGCAEWVAYGDTATSLVQLFVWNAEDLDTVSGLTGECLVHFPYVDILDGETSLFKGLGDGDGWTDTHDLWSASGSGKTEQSTLDWKTESLSRGTLGEEHDGGTVGDLTGVSCSCGSALLEGWLELG